VRVWRRAAVRRVASCRVFDVDAVSFEDPGGHEYFVLDAPDWINVVPVTPEGGVVLVRQFRVGVDVATLEIPGGMCDPGEAPAAAARRELNEETGYDSADLVDLGWVHPNPALQGNRCFTFLARNAVKVGEPRPDGDEEFELVTVDRQEIPALIKNGAITHALVVAAFYRLGLL
jgi:8-oxo-dGTP pyrophosphatase MutT (NUDIX family)